MKIKSFLLVLIFAVAISAVKGGFGRNDNNFIFPAGERTYNVYLICDTLQNVAAQIDHLYTMGVK